MATQQEIQDLTNAVGAIQTGLEAGRTSIEEEFSTLEEQIANAPTTPANELDLAPLRDAITTLGTVADQVDTLKANPPAAAANPAPGGSPAAEQAASEADQAAGQAPTNPQGEAVTDASNVTETEPRSSV